MPRNFPARSACRLHPTCVCGGCFDCRPVGARKTSKRKASRDKKYEKDIHSAFRLKVEVRYFGNWWPAKIRDSEPSHYFLPGNKYKVKFEDEINEAVLGGMWFPYEDIRLPGGGA